MNLKDKFAKAIRILTTAPVFALLLCTLLYFLMDGAFASLRHYLMAVFFLSILPVLAYPVSASERPRRPAQSRHCLFRRRLCWRLSLCSAGRRHGF